MFILHQWEQRIKPTASKIIKVKMKIYETTYIVADIPYVDFSISVSTNRGASKRRDAKFCITSRRFEELKFFINPQVNNSF